MIRSRFHFLEKFLDRYYIRQINAFTEWLAQHFLEHETVFIDLPRQQRSLGKGVPAFIFCAPSGLLAALEKNGRHDADAWHGIFRSTAYEIWEHAEKYESDTLPLRFGLTDEEKNFALTYTRRVLDDYLKTGKWSAVPMGDVPQRFREKACVDVALWVHGTARGSRIVVNLPLITAIGEAAIRSCRDERFKPLAAEELDSTTIEIAVLSDLRMPLLDREIRANTIFPEKGYLMSVPGKSKKGWFLPAVLNNTTFKNLDDFLIRLIEKKVGAPKSFLEVAQVDVFEVDNFIESYQPKRIALSLRGPVLRRKIEPPKVFETIQHIAFCGADFLCRVQEPDGNIPPIIDVLTGKKNQIDCARLAFTAGALALMGNTKYTSQYVETAHKAFRYIIDNLFTHPYLGDDTRCMLYVYACKLAAALGESTEAARIHSKILDLVPKVSYGPINYSQIALHLLECGGKDNALLSQAETFSNAVLIDYEERIENGKYLELAVFPELIPILHVIGNLRDDQKMLQKSEAISKWYVSQQLPDGSFPSAVGRTSPYVRGSGKIFEVLCLEPEKNMACIKRTINWLLEMQYDADNTYFVEERIKKEIIGGFRHDYVNQAVWIDAVAHVLIGAARLRAVQKTVPLTTK